MLNEEAISSRTSGSYLVRGLAFHTLPITIVDPDFAKEQMKLMLRGVCMQPSGHTRGPEWNVSDVNPPGGNRTAEWRRFTPSDKATA